MASQDFLNMTGSDYLNKALLAPKFLNEKLIDVLSSIGVNSTARFAGLLTFLINCILIYFALKISQPILKAVIIISLGLLLVSFFIPIW